MKRSFLKILFLSCTLILSSCRLINVHKSEIEESFVSETSSVESENEESESFSESETTEDSEYESSEYISEESESAEELEYLTLNNNNFYSDNQYQTGNYSMVSNSGISFNCYRTVGNINSAFLRIIGNEYPYADKGLEGTFSNFTPIKGIKTIELTYYATDDFIIAYFADYSDQRSVINLNEGDNQNNKLSFEHEAAYFEIQISSGYVDLYSLEIGYTDKQSIPYNYYDSYQGERINPITFNATLVSGESKVKAYDSNGNLKEYTYYSLDYVETNINQLNIEDVIYIDPVDVSNYYLAFKDFPVNYIEKSVVKNYKTLFGDYLRVRQTYTRKDGYATFVPYNSYNGYPLYYELDIDLDGTYQATSPRGVGRIVIWEYGFSCYSDTDDHIPVIVYTDDHYSTFQEYTNKGTFAPRFNAHVNVVHSIHHPLITK